MEKSPVLHTVCCWPRAIIIIIIISPLFPSTETLLVTRNTESKVPFLHPCVDVSAETGYLFTLFLSPCAFGYKYTK